jgi:hypothetical protein
MIHDRVRRLHCIVWAFLYVREGPSSLTVLYIYFLKVKLGVGEQIHE